MKKLLTGLLALTLLLSFAGAGRAERKKHVRAHRLAGTIQAIDAAAGTLTVKGKKDSVGLKAGEKVKLEGIAVGDKVLVTYSGDSASSVKKVTARKRAKKKAAPAKAMEPAKKEAAPTAPAASAAPAEK